MKSQAVKIANADTHLHLF